MKNRSQSPSVYQIVTDRIVAKLESGVVPWRRPWGEYGIPMNVASKRAYRGVNVFLLSASGFEAPYWLTYRQAQERGGETHPSRFYFSTGVDSIGACRPARVLPGGHT